MILALPPGDKEVMTLRPLHVALLLCIAAPWAAAEERATYTGVNPWIPHFPDCTPGAAATGRSLGMGGACFDVPADARAFQVVIRDDVMGPGFGNVHFADAEGCCVTLPICGSAEGILPEGATRMQVVVQTPLLTAPPHCWTSALAWLPLHGEIAVRFEP